MLIRNSELPNTIVNVTSKVVVDYTEDETDHQTYLKTGWKVWLMISRIYGGITHGITVRRAVKENEYL